MYKGQSPGIRVLFKGLRDLIDTDSVTPAILNHNCRGPTPFYIFFHASAENTVLSDNNFVSRGNEIDEAGFHAGGAGS